MDYFTPVDLFIQNSKCRPYQGSVGRSESGNIDAAYRIVADHARMFTVAISDGLVPGRKESEYASVIS